MFNRKRNNPHGHGKGQSSVMSMSEKAALWIAILSVILLSPQILDIAEWLSRNVLEPAWGYEVAEFAPWVLAFVIAMIALYFARMTLASSLMMATLLVLSRTPIF